MILIAGGIGAGKSIVSRILRLKGYGVYDCDFKARELMENMPSLKDELSGILGPDTYFRDGKLNKEYVSKSIYQDFEKRNAVNACVHAAVREDIRKWLEADAKNMFVESAIGVQSGLAEMSKEVWLVVADSDCRTARVKARNGWQEDHIHTIMMSQSKEEECLRNSGITLHEISNGDCDHVIMKVTELLNSTI